MLQKNKPTISKEQTEPATQEDLKYAFEKLGMTEFIEVAEEEKQIDNTKKWH